MQATRALGTDERSAILDAEVARYVRQGYRLTARTTTTAQLIRPKRFNLGVAILGALFLLIGLVIYLLVYVAQSDETVYLTIDEGGNIQRTGTGRLSNKAGADRWECPACAYWSHSARRTCKQCGANRTEAA